MDTPKYPERVVVRRLLDQADQGLRVLWSAGFYRLSHVGFLRGANLKPGLSALAFLLVFLSGCHSARVVRFDGTEYPPTQYLSIVSDLSSIPWQYVEIGYVEAEGIGKVTSRDMLLDDMKQSAKAAGADALIKIEFYDQETPEAYRQWAKAVMIRYKLDHSGGYIRR